MTREPQHEYTELADLADLADSSSSSDTPATERTYEPTKPVQGSVRQLFRDRQFLKHISLTALYITLWYTFSSLLSVYNKWLFGKTERDFAFPLLVSSTHMLVQYLLATLCLRLFPHLRPQQQPSWHLYLTHAVPCGLASALDIGLSNLSLRTITLTFYTMCKSSGLGFVLLFAFLFGLERVRLVLVAIIMVISVGVVLMAAGEVEFVWTGFMEVLGSSAMSGLRWSLTQILLSQARFGMNNPVATMSRLMPIVGSSMLVLSLVVERPFTELAANRNMQSRGDALFMVLVMCGGGMLAFLMILSEFFLIARTSVVTLSIGGMLKDVLMVAVAHFIFGDSMTLVNACGLMVALFGIGLYNWLKVHDAMSGRRGAGESGGRRAEGHLEEEEEEEAYQRQVVFVADPYNEILAVAGGMRGEGVETVDEVQGKRAVSSGVSEAAGSTRRRVSVRNIDTALPKQVASPVGSEGSDAGAQSEGRSASASASATAESFLAIEQTEASPGPTRLKHRD